MSRGCCACLFLSILLFEILSVSASSGRDLIVNGGFKSQFEGWEPYVYDEVYGRVDLTSGTSHSGTWSLRTYINPARAIPYTRKRGGGVKQVLSNDVEDLNMVLDFWVMPAIIDQNSYTNIRSVVHMELKDGRSVNISYYLAWAPPALGEFLYNTSDTTIFFLPALLHQWSNVKREIKGDFESRFGNSKGVILSHLWILFEMTTVSHMTTPDAFWDDISMVAQAQSQISSSPTQTTAPSPNPQSSSSSSSVTSTTTASATKPTEGGLSIDSTIEKNGTLILLLLAAILGMGAVAVRKSSHRRSEATESPKKHCVNCGEEMDADSKYCERCGARQ